MTDVKSLAKLEAELAELQKQRDDVEKRLRGLDAKERNVKRDLNPQAKKSQTSSDIQNINKRPRDNNNKTEDDASTNNAINKKARLSSVVTGAAPSASTTASSSISSSSSSSSSNRDKERHRETKRESESEHRSKDTRPPNAEVAKRNKRVFGVLLGTLQQFKQDMSKKSQIDKKREEIEHKITEKVKKEQENFYEQQQHALEEEKQAQLTRREDIKKKQEEAENQLLQLKWKQHQELLNNFSKTEAQPCIYWRPHNSADKAIIEKKDKMDTDKEPSEKPKTGEEMDKETKPDPNVEKEKVETEQAQEQEQEQPKEMETSTNESTNE